MIDIRLDATAAPKASVYRVVNDGLKRIAGLISSLFGAIMYLCVYYNTPSSGLGRYLYRPINSADLNVLFKDKEDVIKDGYTGQDKEEIKGKECHSLLFMPVILKRNYIDHIIMVVYNQVEKELEIYDPQGKPLKDLLNENIKCSRYVADGKTIRTLSDYIIAKNLFFKTIRSNHVRQQHDSHSCGLFAFAYFEKRSRGVSAQDIMENGQLTAADVRQIRDELKKDTKNIH